MIFSIKPANGAIHLLVRPPWRNALAAMVNRLTARIQIRHFVMAITCSTPTPLILKRAKFSRSSGQWQDEDYEVLADGKVVGRIYEQGGIGEPPELRWFWSITAIVPASPATHGTAATLDEAEAKFRDTWTKATAGGRA
jgi:hypothetical protein